MSRIASTFARLRAENRAALMPYLMIGYPQRDSVLDLAPALEAVGADMFELGIPFSDPLADGATVQRAGERALGNGISLADCLQTVKSLRERGVAVPLVLMGYYNLMIQYGVARACAELAEAGGDGWIIPDLPPEEADEMHTACVVNQLDLIMLVAPTSPDERIAEVARRASGFIYCVALTGTTGARRELDAGLGDFLARVRRQTDLPLCVGFGVSTADHVARISQMADGAIVASALIDHMEHLAPADLVEGSAAFVRELKTKDVGGRMRDAVGRGEEATK